MRFRNFKKGFSSSVHKIVSTAAVYMYIDKTRRNIIAVCINFNGICKVIIPGGYCGDGVARNKNGAIGYDFVRRYYFTVINFYTLCHEPNSEEKIRLKLWR